MSDLLPPKRTRRMEMVAAGTIATLQAENERLRAALGPSATEAWEHLYDETVRLEAEIERLRAIEKAAERAYRYHMSGYNADSGFDANTQIDIMNALGRTLE